MGSTDAADHRETPAEKLAKSMLISDPKLLAESWTSPQKDTKSAAAPAAESTAPKAQTTQVAKAEAPGKSAVPIKLADATTPDVRQKAVQEDQKLIGALHSLRVREANDTFVPPGNNKDSIDKILKDFDSIEKEAATYNLPAVYQDYKSIQADPSKKAEASTEASLLHSPATILANKAIVAYDAAFKADADKGPINRRQLIDIARQSAATASQDKAVAQTFNQQFQQFEGLVAKYNYAPPIGAPGDRAPAAAPAPRSGDAPKTTAPPERQAPPAAGDAPAPAQAAVGDKPISDQDLAKFAQNAQNDNAARTQLEQQLWGSSADNANAQKYLTTKKDMYIILNNMDGYTDQQKAQFQQNLFGTNASVQDKQNYINKFAAKDQGLHDAASEVLQLAGDKLPTAAQWYVKENSNAIACSAFYEKAIQAENAGKNAQATDYWNKAQKYPIESTFASDLVKDAGVLRMDAIQMGQTQTLYDAGQKAQQGGDLKSAAQFYKDSVVASDISYKANIVDAQKKVEDAHQKLLNGGNLTSDQQLKYATAAYPYTRVLTGPVEARNNAAAALSGLTTDAKGNYISGPGGQKYQATIAQWLNESNAMSKNIDATAIKSIGMTLQSAAIGDLTLNKPGHEQDRQTVAIESQILLGGQLPGTKNADGSITPGVRLPGSSELPYTTPRMLGAYLLTQGHGTDAIKAVQEGAQREAAQRGWTLADTAAKDPMIGKLVAQAKPLDSSHVLDQLTNNESQFKTAGQAIGGALAFTAAVALTHRLTPLLEDSGAGVLAKEGLVGATARAAVKYAPTLAGVGAAVGTSYGIDRLGTTHEGWKSDAVKGLSVVALVKSGKYLSRVGATGFAPEVADNMFGAAKTGEGLSTREVLGRMVTDVSGKPLAESEVTIGKLTERYGTTLSKENLAKLNALPKDLPVFQKGVINPQVNEAFLGTSQRSLGQLSAEIMPRPGVFIPKASEIASVLKGAPIDVASGDANAVSRQLALRLQAAKILGTGSASKATELGISQRLAMEVSNTKNVAESNLTRDQYLDYFKARGVKLKELGTIGNVVGEDAPILQGGKFNPSLGNINSDLQTQLQTIAKNSGKEGQLTSQDLINYANKNKIPVKNFESVLNQDPLMIKNGNWNPNLLIQDAKTGVVSKAIDIPNFKGVTGLDNMTNSQLFSRLAKPGASERSMAVAMAQRSSQQVVGDGAGNVTVGEYIQDLKKGPQGISDAAIAQKYPNLAKLNDDDLIIKNGKFQTKVVQRDLPTNMTAGEFKNWYATNRLLDLNDPAILANSPWKKALSSVSDDSPVLKNGKWQISRLTGRLPKEADQLVNEQTVNVGKAKTVGLAESNGKWLMSDRKANLNVGQFLAAAKDANLDPSKFESLAKMNPDTPIVIDGKMAPVARLSNTSNTFVSKSINLVRSPKTLSLGTTEGQRAVLLGEATDGEPGLNLAKNWRSIVTSPTKAAKASWEIGTTPVKWIGSSVKSMATTAWDTRLGTGALTSVDPTVGKFATQGARYGLQNFVHGSLGVAGSYGLYQAMQTFSGENFDSKGDRVTNGQAFQNRLLGFGNSPDKIKSLEDGVTKQYNDEIQAMPDAEKNALTQAEYDKNLADRINKAKTEQTLRNNIWMPSFYSAYQGEGLPWMNLALTAGLPLASDAITGFSNEHSGANDKLRAQLKATQDLNNKPLVDNPNLVVPDAPPPAPDAPATTAPAAAGPAPVTGDDLTPGQPTAPQ